MKLATTDLKLLSDTDKKVAQQYGSLRNILGLKMAARNTFLIDPQGKIGKVWLGVSPSAHSSEVLSTLAEHAPKSSDRAARF